MRWQFDNVRVEEKNASDGFTLIELLVVLAIMGLLLTITPQLLVAIPRYHLQSSAATLAETLRQLRDQSIRSGQTTTMRFDQDHASYQVDAQTGWTHLPAVVDTITLTRDTPIHGFSEEKLRFFGDGTTNGGIVTLRHGSLTIEITVDWLTGRIRND